MCINPCIVANPCAKTAQCSAQNHRAICSCPIDMIGDPFTNCYKEPMSKVECTHDSDCSVDTACINKRCQNPCAESNPCAHNAECRISYHRPLCYCPPGWGGDPQRMCYKRNNYLKKFSALLTISIVQLNAKMTMNAPTTRLVSTKSASIHAAPASAAKGQNV